MLGDLGVARVETRRMSSDLLLFGCGTRLCALPLEHVDEIMRPLPVEPLSGAPAFVLGASIVRGRPLPVVDLGALFGAPERSGAGRWIAVKAGHERRVALHVTNVLGIFTRDALSLHESPPLLDGADHGVVEALGRRDGALLALLRVGNVVPDAVFAGLKDQGLQA
jgi:purine-binding chemotaxis protein CheW